MATRLSGMGGYAVSARRLWLRLVMCMGLLMSALLPMPADAATPVVKAVFFWSSSCPHCHTVIEQVLPPIQKRYGAQFQLKMLQMERPENVDVYYSAVDLFKISKERMGVPALIIGDQVLVGSQEIPDRLDAEIQKGLAKGGVDYPPLAKIAQAPAVDMCGPNPCGPQSVAVAVTRPDPIGTGIAALVLLGMLVVLAYAARAAVVAVPTVLAGESSALGTTPPWKTFATPGLAIVGLGISAYLAYVEITRSPVLCGPIGNCDVVQTSIYAVFLGVPVAIWGGLAYSAVVILWLVQRFTRGRMAQLATLASVSLLVAAVLFSIYLTLIELLVLHAICTWCVSSAVVVSLLLALAASDLGPTPAAPQQARSRSAI